MLPHGPTDCATCYRLACTVRRHHLLTFPGYLACTCVFVIKKTRSCTAVLYTSSARTGQRSGRCDLRVVCRVPIALISPLIESGDQATKGSASGVSRPTQSSNQHAYVLPPPLRFATKDECNDRRTIPRKMLVWVLARDSTC